MWNRGQLKIGALLSYISIAINILSGLLFTPWMITQIGQSDYGLYTLSNSLITLFLVDFGLSSATSKFVSKCRAERNLHQLNNYLGVIYKLYFGITSVIFVIFVIVFCNLEKIYVNLLPEEISRFKKVYAISVLFAVVNFPCVTFNGILNSFEYFVPLKVADILYRLGFVICTGTALVMGKGLYALVIIHVAIGVLVIIFKYAIIKKKLPIKVNFKYKHSGLYKEIFLFSAWVTISSLAQRASFNFTPTVLGMVVQNASVAISIFGVITTVESYAYLIPGAINGMFLPRISEIFAKKEIYKLDPLLNSVGKYQFAINGLIVAGFAVLGREFLSLWVGEEYTVAYCGILLVIIPGLFYNSMQIANTTIVVANKMKYKAYIDCIMAFVNIALAFALAPKYGIIGVCVAIFAAYLLRVALLCFIYEKILPLDMKAFVRKCFGRMLVPVITTTCVGVMINTLTVVDCWFDFLKKAILISVIYVSLVFLVGLNSDEKRKLALVLKKKTI